MLNPLSALLSIRALFKTRRQIKRSLALQHVMLPGKYKIHWSEKPVLYNEENSSVIENKQIVYPKFLTFFFSRPIVLNYADFVFRGEYAIFSLNREMKIFSVANHQVLTVMPREKKERLQNAAERLSVLNLTFLHAVDSGIVDRWVNDELKAAPFSQKKHLYLQFLDEYKNFICHSPIQGKDASKERMKKISNCGSHISNVITRMSQLVSEEEYPVIFSHCDMHIDNMLFENGKIWYIDIEYARDEIFIYDVFIGMVVAFWNYGDGLLLKEYIYGNGDLVNRITAVFDAAGTTFHVENKKKYLFDFLAARLVFDIENGKKRFNKIGFLRYMKYLARQNNKVLDYIEGLHD